jgi:signal transduction histidine kinase
LDPNLPTSSGPAGASPAPAAPPFDRPIGDGAAPSSVDGGRDRPRRERPSLLVVDDEPEVLRSVHDLLRLDYRVITRGTGAAALEVLRSAEDVHVIMSDQRMPGMSGVDLLRQAKAIRPEVTRLLFTAYADIRAVIDAINQGHIFRYIAKPWDPDELGAVVRQAVEHHDLIVEKHRLVAELQAANAKLTEADRLKGAFLEVASHELNTPVSVILGLIELWRMAPVDTAMADRQWVDRIGAAARRLARTVERMLKLVRSGEFGRPLERQSIALEPLLRRAVDELTPYLELRRQSVVVAVDPGLGAIDVDPDKIADVLINLLANAVKFTPDGGTIRVAASAEPGAPDWVRVSVDDEGLGVPAGDQQYLFEPFFTGFDTLRHSSGDYQFGKRGLGLGLWLVKAFVELHGGRVEVSSTPGWGSNFSFLLPRTAAPGGGSQPDPLAAPGR